MAEACRRENIRRTAEVSKLMVEAGLIVIVAAIAPFRVERDAARGLYRVAREGRIKDFTGIDSPYEAPLAAECRIDTDAVELDDACHRLATFLLKK